jgi:hypothetical protein
MNTANLVMFTRFGGSSHEINPPRKPPRRSVSVKLTFTMEADVAPPLVVEVVAVVVVEVVEVVVVEVVVAEVVDVVFVEVVEVVVLVEVVDVAVVVVQN